MVGDRRQGRSDRRGARRVPVVFAVRNRIEDARARVQLGQAEDLCPGGMTLRRPKDAALLPSTPMRLAFELPGTGTELTLGGVVVRDWRVGRWRRVGVRFVGVEAEQLRILEAYCEAKGGYGQDGAGGAASG